MSPCFWAGSRASSTATPFPKIRAASVKCQITGAPPGTLMGVGPFGMRKPLLLPTEEAMEKITRPILVEPVARIEARVAGIPAGGTVHMTLHPHNETAVRGGFDYPIQPYLSYQREDLVGILDAVRNKLLELTVDLQKRLPDLDLDRTTPELRHEAAAVVLQVIN